MKSQKGLTLAGTIFFVLIIAFIVFGIVYYVRMQTTKEELEADNRQVVEREISELKRKLSDTDYKAIKYAEGFLTEEEYKETKAQRQMWRDRINKLEVL